MSKGMATRADMHSPSNMVSADYIFRGVFYVGADPEMSAAYHPDNLDTLPRLNRSTYTGNWKDKGTCDHCGARFSHGVCFEHIPSGELIAVGHICANDHFEKDDWQEERKRREREAQRAKKIGARNRQVLARVEAFLSEHEELAEILELDHSVLRGMKASLLRFGALTERQLTYARQVADKVRHPPAPERWRKVEESDRRTLRGRIVGLKTKESHYGVQHKMLVVVGDPHSEEGAEKLWITRPAALSDANRGDLIELSCRTTRSPQDPYFGFGSRPTKARILAKE